MPLNAQSAENYITGKVYDITSISSGLLIRVEGNQVPGACVDLNPHGWMLIPEEFKTMTSVALTMWTTEKRQATIYVSGAVGSYCRVTQYDPHSG